MICRLCLSHLNDAFTVPIFRNDIAHMISKYLALEFSTDDNISTRICLLCCKHLEDFHRFWILVDGKQKTLQNQQPYEFFEVNLMSNAAIDDKDDDGDDEEGVGNLNAITIKEELLQLEFDPVCDDNDDSNLTDTKDISSDELWKPVDDIKLIKTAGSYSKTRSKAKAAKKLNKRQKITKDIRNEQPDQIESTIKSIKLNCEICDAHVENFEELTNHFESEHSDQQPYFKCCGKTFIEREAVASHLKCHNASKEYNCPICNKSFFSKKNLNIHLKSRHEEDRKAFKCHVCQKGFRSQKYCDSHVLRHNGEKKILINCDKCKRSFTSIMRLKRHCQIMHEAVYPYKCHACEENFLTKRDLESHQDFCKNRSVLKEDRKAFSSASDLICTICCKIFANSNRLRKHIDSVHKNIHPYVCEQCGKKFKFKPTFETHLLEHSGIVEPPAQCNICGKWLKHKNSLRLHLYAHDNSINKCELCSHVAPTRAALRNHVKKKHRLEREYECKYCDKSFKDSKSQEEHIATHTGAQLYSCPHCPKETRSSSNMYAHVKRMHPQEWQKAKLARSHDPIAKKNLGSLVS